MSKLKKVGIRKHERRMEITDVLIRKRRKSRGASVLFLHLFFFPRPYGPKAVRRARRPSLPSLTTTSSSSSDQGLYSPLSRPHHNQATPSPRAFPPRCHATLGPGNGGWWRVQGLVQDALISNHHHSSLLLPPFFFLDYAPPPPRPPPALCVP